MAEKRILVTGGAGYIGSHTNAMLRKMGKSTLVLDNLSYGHKQSLELIPYIQTDKDSAQSQSYGDTFLIQADLNDTFALKKIFNHYDIDSVLHFAAFTYVGESVSDPAKYYRNNVANTLNLLETMKEFDCKKIVFSSTCATYGNPLELPLKESHPQNPINPYGRSKLMIEQILHDFSNAYGLSYVILRYFNAAGASIAFNIGESHSPETHLIPLVIQKALGQRKTLSVFGQDYDTKDGSCIRDYIHVDDLATAHILALEYLNSHQKSEVFNLGNGEGFSVLEVIKKMSEISNKEIPYIVEERRAGDPAILIGDSTKAKEILGYNPSFSSLETILKSAYQWHTNQRY